MTIIHHIYDEDGNLRIWNDERGITIRSFEYQEFAHYSAGVVVELDGIPVLRYECEYPTVDARILANLIFNTNKEYAS